MKIERKSIICSLKPTASPDQANNPTFSSPTSSRRGIRRQPTAYEPSSSTSSASSAVLGASTAQMAPAQAASSEQSQQQPLKSGWFSNPNLAMEKEKIPSGNPPANLTKRVKLAKATKIGRWTSVQSGHLMIS